MLLQLCVQSSYIVCTTYVYLVESKMHTSVILDSTESVILASLFVIHCDYVIDYPTWSIGLLWFRFFRYFIRFHKLFTNQGL